MDFLSCFDFSKRTSLYIHIPFCRSKCSYCAFYSCPGIDEKTKDEFTEKIVKEIDALTTKMSRPFYTAFIGGGNPGCLLPEQLEKICKAVCKNGRPLEFTTEMNPECLSKGHFPLFENFFTRLSMGIQSLDNKALEFLGRNTSLEQTINGLNLSLELKQLFHTSISYDLITCLGKWHNHLEDVRKICSVYNPDHLSIYALTLEEGTPLFAKKPNLPNSDEQYDILNSIWLYTSTLGYNHYEVSNFAKPGKESLHNSVYWDYEQYVGLGPGAASTAFKEFTATRLDFEKNIKQYISSDLFANFRSETLSKEEELEEFVMMGLRHKKGLDLQRLKYGYGKQIFNVPEGFQVLNNRLCPSDSGLMVADAAALNVLRNLS